MRCVVCDQIMSDCECPYFSEKAFNSLTGPVSESESESPAKQINNKPIGANNAR